MREYWDKIVEWINNHPYAAIAGIAASLVALAWLVMRSSNSGQGESSPQVGYATSNGTSVITAPNSSALYPVQSSPLPKPSIPVATYTVTQPSYGDSSGGIVSSGFSWGANPNTSNAGIPSPNSGLFGGLNLGGLAAAGLVGGWGAVGKAALGNVASGLFGGSKASVNPNSGLVGLGYTSKGVPFGGFVGLGPATVNTGFGYSTSPDTPFGGFASLNSGFSTSWGGWNSVSLGDTSVGGGGNSGGGKGSSSGGYSDSEGYGSDFGSGFGAGSDAFGGDTSGYGADGFGGEW